MSDGVQDPVAPWSAPTASGNNPSPSAKTGLTDPVSATRVIELEVHMPRGNAQIPRGVANRNVGVIDG